ncbi:C-type lectin lectoxin-Thr1-like [Ruditapes philippinarum]|uniref:C-type lectin lectoxin-Thr1-like n=1 Tax=Ruditapes philippinarum TaxID=129788 RepID=UPI00295A7956|nr:C-type lectin lectoxin-Thr1-like [Ruditapes philippinarum]
MKMRGGKVFLVFIFSVVIVTMDISSASLIQSNGTAEKDITGEMLLKLGRTLNKPVITLLGMAIRNLENLHPCYDWTQWSECGALREGYIDSRIRTRKCGRYQSGDKLTTETDIGICEGICSKAYNLTANGFCVKLYVERKSFNDAEKQCQVDGGHVINIDSELKNGDVTKLLQGFNTHIYIDGQRKNTSSAWLTINGSKKQFFHWASGEPHSGLCIIIHSNSYWYDSTVCTTSRPFICEI